MHRTVMKICPTIFGPYFWSVVHMTALSAPSDMNPEKVQSYIRFFESLPDILPCVQCGKHLKENLTILPPDPTDMFRWSVDLHNLVNTQLNKPEIPYDKALTYWSSRCTRTPDRDRIVMIVGGVLLAFIIVILLSRTK